MKSRDLSKDINNRDTRTIILLDCKSINHTYTIDQFTSISRDEIRHRHFVEEIRWKVTEIFWNFHFVHRSFEGIKTLRFSMPILISRSSKNSNFIDSTCFCWNLQLFWLSLRSIKTNQKFHEKGNSFRLNPVPNWFTSSRWATRKFEKFVYLCPFHKLRYLLITGG